MIAPGSVHSRIAVADMKAMPSASATNPACCAAAARSLNVPQSGHSRSQQIMPHSGHSRSPAAEVVKARSTERGLNLPRQ